MLINSCHLIFVASNSFIIFQNSSVFLLVGNCFVLFSQGGRKVITTCQPVSPGDRRNSIGAALAS